MQCHRTEGSQLRIQYLARGLAQEMEWEVDVDGKFDKEVCVYSLNTVILAFSSAYNVSRWGRRLISGA